MSRYQIWNKTDDVYTPVGEIFSAEQWLNRYGWAKHPNAVPVVASGLINGAYMGELGQMKEMAAQMGCEFTESMTNQEVLDAIEAFEQQANSAEPAPSAEERTAAALEFIAMSSLPDETETV